MRVKQWLRLTTSDPPLASCVFLRLIKVPKSQKFDVAYTQRVFNNDTMLFLQLLTSESMISQLRNELTNSSRKSKPLKEIKRLENSLQGWKVSYEEARSSRIRNRFWLLAARYYLLDPKGVLFEEDDVYQEAVQHRSVIDRAKAYTKLAMSLVKRRSSAQVDSHDLEERESQMPASFKEERAPASAPIIVPLANRTPAEEVKVVKEVIEKLQAPAVIGSSSKIAGNETQIPRNTLEEVGKRIKPPTRAMTSQSQILPRPPGRGSILRARTTAASSLDNDSAAPFVRKPRRGITFALENMHHDHLPIHVTAQNNKDRSGTSNLATVIQDERRQPYIFRLQASTAKESRSMPTAMSALRLPSARRPRPGMLSLDNATLPPSPARAGQYPKLGPASSKLELSRREKAMRLLQPFFEWRSALPATPSTPRTSDLAQPTYKDDHRNGSQDANSSGNMRSMAAETLDILHLEMQNPYQTTEEFAIRPSDYSAVEAKSTDDVVKALDAQSDPSKEHPLDQQGFWDAKASILISVDTVLSCFVGRKELSDTIIQKIWGLVFNICQVSLEEVSMPLFH